MQSFTGSLAYSEFPKPSLTVHYGDFSCTGSETSITDCSYTTYSLYEGKSISQQASTVGGVRCNRCSVPVPPTNNDGCSHGDLRLTGGQQSGVEEGRLQYCVEGSWSDFCYLGSNEANVACRQFGFADIDGKSCNKCYHLELTPTHAISTLISSSLFLIIQYQWSLLMEGLVVALLPVFLLTSIALKALHNSLSVNLTPVHQHVHRL